MESIPFPKSLQKWNLVIITMALVGMGLAVGLFICLEIMMPIQRANVTEPVANSTLIVRSYPMQEYLLQHRKGYLRNTHIQMMSRVQQRLNVTDCWLCAHLPQTAEKGIMPYAQPLPFNTTCYAIYHALFQNPVGRLAKTLEKQSREFDTEVLGPLNCSIYYETPHMPRNKLLGYKRNTLPYADLIASHGVIKGDPAVDCAGGTLHGPTCPTPIHVHVVQEPEFCIGRKGTYVKGYAAHCPFVIDVTPIGPVFLAAGRSVYFICGDHAYAWLPEDWSGICYPALLLPDILPVRTEHLSLLRQHAEHIQVKRAVQASDFVKGLFPMYGIIANSIAIRALGTLFEEAVNATTSALVAMSLEMRAIRLVALQNRIGLDLILAKEGGLCEIVGVSCCSFIPDESGTVAASLEQLHKIEVKVHKIAEETGPSLSSWFSGIWTSWGWKILIGIFALLAVLLLVCLCIQCLPMLCAQCAAALSRPVSATQIMMSRFDPDPILDSSYLVHVPGYGPLARAQYDRPMLYVRHLYIASPYSPSSEACKDIPRSQFPRYRYALKPEVYTAQC